MMCAWKNYAEMVARHGRPLSEVYDTQTDVVSDPFGAREAIEHQDNEIIDLARRVIAAEKLVEALRNLVPMLDALAAESGRGIEYGHEDAFRMGEWFEDSDLTQIEAARAALAEYEATK